MEENNIMNIKNPQFKNIVKYYRYVDDTFFIFTGTDRNTDQLLNYLNSICPEIQYTIEKMQNNEINFLDLTVYINKSGLINFRIYRKPTSTDSIIPYRSNHPINQKHAAIHAMAHRLYAIPLNYKDRITEISTIHEICRRNGYPRHIVNKILTKHKNKNKTRDQIECHKKVKQEYRKMDFFNDTSNIISKHFKKQRYTPAYITNNNVLNNIKKLSSKYKKETGMNQDNKNISGVYKITCKDCDESYIGKTERSIQIRTKEHMTKETSNVFRHMKSKNHSIDQNVQILHKSQDKKYINVREKFEIVKAINNNCKLMNIQTEIDNVRNVLINKCTELLSSGEYANQP